MNGITRTPRRIGALRPLWLGLVLLGSGFCGSSCALASAIHHAEKDLAAEGIANPSWSQYLMGGPSVWAAVAHPALSPTIEAEMWKSIRNDPPPVTSSVVQFFLYKQSLDPTRFDHYHPKVAVALAKINAELAKTASTPTTSTSTTSTTPTDQAQQITPPGSSGSSPDVNAVPEPATILLTVGMAGYAVWWRRRRD